MAQMAWPKEREEQLRRWWTTMSGGMIANKFGADGFPVTRNAVVGKAHRMRLSVAQTRINVETLCGGRPRAKIVGPKMERPRKQKLTAIIQGTEIRRPRVYGMDGGGGCRWIEGDVREAGWFYCNEPKIRGSYCQAHAVMCYLPDQRRALFHD